MSFNVDEVRISVQTDPNSLDANPKWFTIPTASVNVKATEGLIEIDSLNAGAEPNGSFLSGIEDIGGNISFNMQYSLMRWLSEMGIGDGTTVALASGDWTASTTVSVGDVVNGTTPATHDLVAYEVTGTGQTGVSAPDTTSLNDGDTVVDNEVTWIVRTSDINKTTGGIAKCQKRFAIEVKISSECGVDTYYFRKLGCVVSSLGFSFAKDGSMMKADMAIIGAISETNIKQDGTVDATYEDLSAITGNTELELENGVYIKQSDMDFFLNGVASESITTFSVNIDNGTAQQNLLSKQNGKNTKKIYSQKRTVTGSAELFFDPSVFGKMDGVSRNSAEVILDMLNGEYFKLSIPNLKFSKDEPDFTQEAVMLSPEWSAEYIEADGSAMQYEVHSAAVAYA